MIPRLIVFAAVFALGLSGPTAYAGQGDAIKEVDACGFVVDTTGSVVADAAVMATSGDKTIATASTLSDGSFHFEESINSGIVLKTQARGYAPASAAISRIRAVKSDSKCKRPIYVVLAAGNGASFITVKKKNVPKSH